MIKKTFTYMNFNDEKVTETCYFNISKGELAAKSAEEGEGLKEKLERVAESKNRYEILGIIKEFILFAYGEKTSDGRSLMKTPEITKAFECSEPFSMLYTQMYTDANAFTEFIKGVMPKDLMANVNVDEAEIKDLPLGIS